MLKHSDLLCAAVGPGSKCFSQLFTHGRSCCRRLDTCRNYRTGLHFIVSVLGELAVIGYIYHIQKLLKYIFDMMNTCLSAYTVALNLTGALDG